MANNNNRGAEAAAASTALDHPHHHHHRTTSNTSSSVGGAGTMTNTTTACASLYPVVQDLTNIDDCCYVDPDGTLSIGNFYLRDATMGCDEALASASETTSSFLGGLLQMPSLPVPPSPMLIARRMSASSSSSCNATTANGMSSQSQRRRKMMTMPAPPMVPKLFGSNDGHAHDGYQDENQDVQDTPTTQRTCMDDDDDDDDDYNNDLLLGNLDDAYTTNDDHDCCDDNPSCHVPDLRGVGGATTSTAVAAKNRNEREEGEDDPGVGARSVSSAPVTPTRTTRKTTVEIENAEWLFRHKFNTLTSTPDGTSAVAITDGSPCPSPQRRHRRFSTTGHSYQVTVKDFDGSAANGGVADENNGDTNDPKNKKDKKKVSMHRRGFSLNLLRRQSSIGSGSGSRSSSPTKASNKSSSRRYRPCSDSLLNISDRDYSDSLADYTEVSVTNHNYPNGVDVVVTAPAAVLLEDTNCLSATIHEVPIRRGNNDDHDHEHGADDLDVSHRTGTASLPLPKISLTRSRSRSRSIGASARSSGSAVIQDYSSRSDKNNASDTYHNHDARDDVDDDDTNNNTNLNDSSSSSLNTSTSTFDNTITSMSTSGNHMMETSVRGKSMHRRKRSGYHTKNNTNRDHNHNHQHYYLNHRKPTFDEQYVLTRMVFRCENSQIWETVHRQSGERYCVKIIPGAAEDEHTEAEKLAAAQGSNNIVQLIETIRDDTSDSGNLYIVMEYIPNNLLTRVVQNDGLEEEHVKVLMKSILEGVQHLHKKGIVHIDLHPSNLLLSSEDNTTSTTSCKICDFGSAVMATDLTKQNNHRRQPSQGQQQQHPHHQRSFSGASTASSSTSYGVMPYSPAQLSGYAAPEVLYSSGTGRYALPTSQADMWSVGAIMHFCLFACLPPMLEGSSGSSGGTIGNSNHHHRRKPSYSSVPMLCQKKPISREAKQLLSGLLHIDPTVRFTPQEALNHAWFQSMGYEVVYTKLETRRTAALKGKKDGKENSQMNHGGMFGSRRCHSSSPPHGGSDDRRGHRHGRGRQLLRYLPFRKKQDKKKINERGRSLPASPSHDSTEVTSAYSTAFDTVYSHFAA